MNQQIKIGAVPITDNGGLNGFLSDMKRAVEHLTSATPSPQPVSNLKATPLAGAIQISFTRSNAANFRLYYGSSPDRTKASIVDLGSNNQWVDNVGQGGVTRFYWVQAIAPNALSPSSITGPLKSTSLALGTNTTVPEQPIHDQSSMLVFDATIHAYRPAVYGQDYVQPGRQAGNG